MSKNDLFILPLSDEIYKESSDEDFLKYISFSNDDCSIDDVANAIEKEYTE